MPGVVFVREKTESSEKESENNNKFRKEHHKKGAKKMEGNKQVHIWRENRKEGI